MDSAIQALQYGSSSTVQSHEDVASSSSETSFRAPRFLIDAKRVILRLHGTAPWFEFGVEMPRLFECIYVKVHCSARNRVCELILDNFLHKGNALGYEFTDTCSDRRRKAS